MKLNQKDAMQTEDKESIRQRKITFQTKTTEFFFFCSRQSTADFLDMTSSIILQNSASLSFRPIHQTSILYTSLQSVRSATPWHFAYRPQLVTV